jgi:hypothetical protein
MMQWRNRMNVYFLPHCICRLVALFGHAAMSGLGPLCGQKRTSLCPASVGPVYEFTP